MSENENAGTVEPMALPGSTGKKVFTEVATSPNTAILLLAPNGRRVSCELQNLGTTDLWIASDMAVSPTHGFKVQPDKSYYDPHSTDGWYGYQATSAGSVHVVEVTQ